MNEQVEFSTMSDREKYLFDLRASSLFESSSRRKRSAPSTRRLTQNRRSEVNLDLRGPKENRSRVNSDRMRFGSI